MILLLSLLLRLMPLLPTPASPRPAPAIRWLTPQLLADSMRVRPRPVLVKVYTTWCRYCQLQDLTTFRNKNVVAQLGAGYYAVALDAESRQPVRLGGHTFGFAATGPGTGVHELAVALARDERGQLIYPTTVLLGPDLRVRNRWSGLLKPAPLLAALGRMATEKQP